jgi:hypothetical protein
MKEFLVELTIAIPEGTDPAVSAVVAQRNP